VNGRVALVTGGAGGIGTALCGRLGRLGYRVVVVDLDLAAAQAVAEPLGGKAFRADVGDPDDNRAMVADALESYGRLDVAVLNAGVNSEQPPDVAVNLERYRQTSAVNVDGVVFGIDACTPALARQGGAVVVMASLAALRPEQANPLYAMAKSAVLGYVRAMSVPLARSGITVNALCPGFTDTPILGIARKLMRKQGFPLLSPDDVADAFATVLSDPGTGQAWALVAGLPATRFAFPAIPTTLSPDGTEVELRPFLAPRS
jgi:NAD(P)-dependent dehydrogenase (short-subunit alcohol dehydrogenase family)